MNEHDQQVRHLLDAGDLRGAAALVVGIFGQRLATIVLQHVRKHEPSIAALSNSHACETDKFQELHDHVVDSILLPDALAAALADFDPHLGSVSAWLAKRVHWSCSDWYRRRPSLPQTIDADELLSSVPSRPEDDEPLCEQRSHDFDSCVAGLPNKQQAVMLLSVDPFYSMTPGQVDLICRVASDSGQPPEVTRQRIDEMREQNREPIAVWYAADAQIQSLKDDVSQQERESQFRRARLIQAGLSETQIRTLEAAAQASREIRVIESRYKDLNPHDSPRQDQKHLELALVRLAHARRRLEKAKSSRSLVPPKSPSKAIARCLNWSVTQVDMALNRARGSLAAAGFRPPETDIK